MFNQILRYSTLIITLLITTSLLWSFFDSVAIIKDKYIVASDRGVLLITNIGNQIGWGPNLKMVSLRSPNNLYSAVLTRSPEYHNLMVANLIRDKPSGFWLFELPIMVILLPLSLFTFILWFSTIRKYIYSKRQQGFEVELKTESKDHGQDAHATDSSA